MTKENEYLEEASKALFMLNADDLARERSYAREDRMRYEHTLKRIIAEKDNEIAEKDKTLATLNSRIAELEAQLRGK